MQIDLSKRNQAKNKLDLFLIEMKVFIMSNYKVIAAIGDTLRDMLWEALRTDSEIGQLFQSKQDIVFRNPAEAMHNTSNRLSLWLYQINENEFVKNQPPIRGKDPKLLKRAPLALTLSYLITPLATLLSADSTGRDEDHLIIGKVMQVFHDCSTLIVRDTINQSAEELRINLKRLTLEELTRVWDALREPYRLSLCYQVQVPTIDSNTEIVTSRVVECDLDYRDNGSTSVVDQDVL